MLKTGSIGGSSQLTVLDLALVLIGRLGATGGQLILIRFRFLALRFGFA